MQSENSTYISNNGAALGFYQMMQLSSIYSLFEELGYSKVFEIHETIHGHIASIERPSAIGLPHETMPLRFECSDLETIAKYKPRWIEATMGRVSIGLLTNAEAKELFYPQQKKVNT